MLGAIGTVWTDVGNLATNGTGSPDRPTHSEWLCFNNIGKNKFFEVIQYHLWWFLCFDGKLLLLVRQRSSIKLQNGIVSSANINST